MKVWRVWNRGDWPEFTIDIIADDVESLLDKFDYIQVKRRSVADRKQIVKIELVGDPYYFESDKKEIGKDDRV